MAFPKGWDWRRKVPVWDYHSLAIAKFPGFDKQLDGEPAWFLLSGFEQGGASSRDLAIAMDDVASGLFYYRDHTDDGIPFIHDKERYKASFTLSSLDDVPVLVGMVRDRRVMIERTNVPEPLRAVTAEGSR